MYLFLPLIAAIAFALGSMVYKRAYMEGAGVVHLTVVNNAILGVAFLPLLALDDRPVPWQEWHRPVLTGLTFTVGHLLNVLALRLGDVSVATPLLGSKIIFVALLGWLLFGVEVTGLQWAAAALGSLGVAFLGLTDFHGGTRRMGLTTTAALGCAAAFSLTDTTIQAWSSSFGPWSYLALQFAALGVFSSLLLPYFGTRSLRISRAAWKWVLIGACFSGLQAVLITVTIAIWKDAVGVNVVYATRGLWSIAFVWTLGHWMKSGERENTGARRMFLRAAGALLIFAAAALSVKSAGAQ